MQALIDKFGTNATYLIGAGVALVVLVLLIFLVRAVFGGRIRPSGGGRSRQPRLGVVDAYDLDRQRQLVLVRRDNVEHLVMIGGPNDVVIESTIIRTTAAGEVRQRVVPALDEPPAAVAPPATIVAPPTPAPAPVMRNPVPPPPAQPAPSLDELVQAVNPPRLAPAPAPVPAAPAPVAPARVAPLPASRPLPRVEPPLPRPAAPATAAPLPPQPLPVPPPPPPVAAEKPAAAETEPARKRFEFGRLVNRAPAEPVAAAAEAPRAPVTPPVPDIAPPAPQEESIDPLELEMAKLLGRPSSQSG